MNRRRNSFIKKIFVVTAVLLILFGVSKIFPGFFSQIGKPVWKARDSFLGMASNSTLVFKSKSDLEKENNALKEELDGLKKANILNDIYKERALELEDILDIKKGDSLVARVLSKPPHSPYDSLIIDKGSADGVEKGDKVFVQNNYILGTISSVNKNTSKVELFSSPEKIISVELENGTSLEASGMGSGNFFIKMPRDIEISNDDIIFYPSSEVSVVGLIKGIESKTKDPFKSVYIKSPVNINELKWVEIIK